MADAHGSHLAQQLPTTPVTNAPLISQIKPPRHLASPLGRTRVYSPHSGGRLRPQHRSQHRSALQVHHARQLFAPLVDWMTGLVADAVVKRLDAADRGEEAGPSPLDIEEHKLPKHVAVIMDGNGRWATSRRQPVMFGHDKGVQALRDVVECCGTWGIPYLTVYAFSTENWNRGRDEVNFLFSLMERVLTQELESMSNRGVRLRFFGQLAQLPDDLQAAMQKAEAATAGNSVLNFNIAISYSGREDMTSAVQSIAAKIAGGELQPEQVTADLISQHLTTAQLPADVQCPDLIIRTSGEQRLSNFLLWEAAYSELYFTQVYWPDFGEKDLRAALEHYASRDRRYGRRGSDSSAPQQAEQQGASKASLPPRALTAQPQGSEGAAGPQLAAPRLLCRKAAPLAAGSAEGSSTPAKGLELGLPTVLAVDGRSMVLPGPTDSSTAALYMHNGT